MPARTCLRCGGPIEPSGRPNRTGRPRKYCRACASNGKHTTCVYCAEFSDGQRFCNATCQANHAWERMAPPISIRTCSGCAKPYATLTRGVYCSVDCKRESRRSYEQRRPLDKRRASSRNQRHRRRAAMVYSDVKATDIAEMLRARKCAKCACHLTTGKGPRQKQIDHIVPIAAGGTHTLGNLRVICRTCNLTRPNDGSDVVGQVSLWATDIIAAQAVALPETPHRRIFYGPKKAEWRAWQTYRRKTERHERVAGLAALALALRLQGHTWRDIEGRLGYPPSAARTSVVHHWPDALPDLAKVTARQRESTKPNPKLEDMERLRSEGLTWDEIARRLNYANGRSALRCVRGMRKRTTQGAGGK